MSKTPKVDPAIAKRVKQGVDHFTMTMGHLPIQMKTMSEKMPDVFAGYMDIRQWVMRDPPVGGMPRKYKHLIFTLLDCVYDNPPGAENHARAAFRNGLTELELLEGMVQALIVGGVGVYGRTAYKVLDNVLAEQAKLKAAGKAKQPAKKAAAKPAKKAAAKEDAK